MIIIPKVELDDADAAWLAGMANDIGLTLKQLCESLLVRAVVEQQAIREAERARHLLAAHEQEHA